ncbi:MAG: hypothetical protein SGJ24_05850 [Chloroflexota bacterium]|nr:hypothetical protein [Chloroflexota bacterium]
MRVAVLANLKANAPTWQGIPHDQWDDLDSPKSVGAIVDALRANGHSADYFEAQVTPPHSLIEKLTAYHPDICFNIAESHFGDGREAQIPALLEMLRIPYTGSRVLSQAIALDKAMTKRIAAYHGLPTPEYQIFERADDPISADFLTPDGGLRFPLFVKPNREGTSMGVTIDSIVTTPDALRTQVAAGIVRYHQPILVERYIRGREVMVGMVGNCPPFDPRQHTPADLPQLAPDLHFFSILEMDVALTAATEGDLYTSEMKKDMAVLYRYHCPAPLTDEQAARLRYQAAGVFSVIDARDISRVDFRLDADDGDAPYILEINTLPGLTPSFSDLCVQAESDGWAYEKLVGAILDAAARRWSLTA